MFLANLILMDPSWVQRLYVLALPDLVKVSIVQNASILADKAYSPDYMEVKIGQQVLFINNDVNNTLLHLEFLGNHILERSLEWDYRRFWILAVNLSIHLMLLEIIRIIVKYTQK